MLQRHERIRFFITEQCRQLDPTFRAYVYPKQILVGDIPLPLLENSSLTFRVNTKKDISFRIRLRGDEELNREPINIGIPLSQVESISVKDHSKIHPEAALVFLLQEGTMEKLIELCHPLLDSLRETGTGRRIGRYMTVIAGMDPNLANPNPVYYRVIVLANKFTFPFKTAKKIMLNDLKIMWEESLEKQYERRTRTGIHHDRELMTEMDDAAWTWLMSFLKVKWVHHPSGGYKFARNESAHRNREVVARRPWSLNTEYTYMYHQMDVESTSESPESFEQH